MPVNDNRHIRLTNDIQPHQVVARAMRYSDGDGRPDGSGRAWLEITVYHDPRGRTVGAKPSSTTAITVSAPTGVIAAIADSAAAAVEKMLGGPPASPDHTPSEDTGDEVRYTVSE